MDDLRIRALHLSVAVHFKIPVLPCGHLANPREPGLTESLEPGEPLMVMVPV